MTTQPRHSDDRRVPWHWHLGLFSLLGVAIALDRWASAGAFDVEEAYTQGLYLPIAQASRPIAEAVPIPITEALIALAVFIGLERLVGAALLVGRGRRSLKNVASHALARALALGGCGALAFMLLWGLNLHRQPLGQRVGVRIAPASQGEVAAVATQLLEEASQLRGEVHEGDDGVFAYPGGHREAARRAFAGYEALSRTFPELGGAYSDPKGLIFSGVVTYMGIAGFFGPPSFEAQYNTWAPHSSLLFVMCHEQAHQRGVVPEDEAGYVGYLACRAHPDPAFRYSAAFSAFRYVSLALGRADREAATALWAQMPEAMRRDSDHLDVFLTSHDTIVREATAKAHDAALKVQGQDAGLKTYGGIVDWLVADFRRETTAP